MKHTSISKTTTSLFLIFCLWSLVYCSYARAGIVLRIVGVNPNEELTQTVELKSYLPEEVEPGDIIEKDDLEVIYDTQKGAYYVYGEYSLKPKQSISREIEIRDIWVIPDADIEGMRQDTLKTATFLENTQFNERSNFLKKGIEEKLDGIVERQKLVTVDPQKHISNYRRNVEILESAKTDLILLKSLFGQSKPLPSVSIWRVFLFIIAFLGLISFTLFLFWRKRIRAPEEVSTEEGELSSEADKRSAPPEGEGDEEKTSASDVEKMLGEDEKE